MEATRITGTCRFYCAARGYGFLIADEIDGDILIHHKALKPHNRRSLPPGTAVDCMVYQRENGWCVEDVLGFDFHNAEPEREQHRPSWDDGGEFEPVVAKWWNAERGYGFVMRGEEDVFVHRQTLRQFGFADIAPGQLLQAKIATSRKGLTAVAVRS
jgi:CspA family cold shock protein